MLPNPDENPGEVSLDTWSCLSLNQCVGLRRAPGHSQSSAGVGGGGTALPALLCVSPQDFYPLDSVTSC